jgi:hypothetical protein
VSRGTLSNSKLTDSIVGFECARLDKLPVLKVLHPASSFGQRFVSELCLQSVTDNQIVSFVMESQISLDFCDLAKC